MMTPVEKAQALFGLADYLDTLPPEQYARLFPGQGMALIPDDDHSNLDIEAGGLYSYFERLLSMEVVGNLFYASDEFRSRTPDWMASAIRTALQEAGWHE